MDVEISRVFFLRCTLEAERSKLQSLEKERDALLSIPSKRDELAALTRDWKGSLCKATALRRSVRDLRRSVMTLRRKREYEHDVASRTADGFTAELYKRSEAFREACKPLERLASVTSEQEILDSELERLQQDIASARHGTVGNPMVENAVVTLSVILLEAALKIDRNVASAAALVANTLAALNGLISCPALMQRASIERVLRLMLLYPQVPEIQGRGSRLLWKLAVRGPGLVTPALLEFDAMLMMTRSIKTFAHEEQVHYHALGCLRSLVPAEPFRFAVTRGDFPMLNSLCELLGQKCFVRTAFTGRAGALIGPPDARDSVKVVHGGVNFQLRSRKDAIAKDVKASDAAVRFQLRDALVASTEARCKLNRLKPTIDLGGVVDLWSVAIFCVCRASKRDTLPSAAVSLLETASCSFEVLSNVQENGSDSLRASMAHRHIMRIACILLRSAMNNAQVQATGCCLLAHLVAECDKVSKAELEADGVRGVFESAREAHPQEVEVQRVAEIMLASFFLDEVGKKVPAKKPGLSQFPAR